MYAKIKVKDQIIKTRQFNSKMTALISELKTIHFTVSEILPGQNFKGQGHYGKLKAQIDVIS